MTDRIIITELELFAKHGVYPEEQVLGQKFVLSAVLYTDTRKAGMEDALEASTDYGAVCHAAKRFFEEHTYRLIEAAAEQLARHLLRSFPLVQTLTLRLEKPWAPIGLPVKAAAVEITRGWHRCYVALGSNMGDKEGHLRRALKLLEETEDIRVKKVSDFFVTAPYGVTDQEDFLNGCAELETLLPPYELLDRLHAVEADAGRVRTLRWGPRTLDLDILFYDDLVTDEEDLAIPHRDMHNRDFVLRPLRQIAPLLRHPVTHKTVEEMERELR